MGIMVIAYRFVLGRWTAHGLSYSSVPRMGRWGLGVHFVLLSILTAAFNAHAGVFTFSNNASITINDNAAASLYPSSISVSGVTGVITKVVVRVFGISHTRPDNIEMLLRSPTAGTGQANVMLMSDAGGFTSITNVNLAFDDCAPRTLRRDSQIVSGRYKPANYLGLPDEFPVSPTVGFVPTEPHSTSLAVFNGLSGSLVNFNWDLFVFDDQALNSGTISGGWSITFYTDTSLAAGANPVPCAKPDFDGDGRADMTVYRSGTWFIRNSSDGSQTTAAWGGAVQDIPVAEDYDGDGLTDIAIYRNGVWYIRRSSDGGQTTIGWGGAADDVPVPADYDGDGKADVAVYRASTGAWFVLRSSDGGQTTIGWGGTPGDVPIN